MRMATSSLIVFPAGSIQPPLPRWMVKPPHFFKDASSIAARAMASSTSVFGAPSFLAPSPNISVYSVSLMVSLLQPKAIGRLTSTMADQARQQWPTRPDVCTGARRPSARRRVSPSIRLDNCRSRPHMRRCWHRCIGRSRLIQHITRHEANMACAFTRMRLGRPAPVKGVQC